jgi:integrase/recombinase XerD
MRSFREGEKILLEWFGGDFCVHDLTRNALNKLLAHRRDSKPKPRAPITANKPCKVLRAALHYAVADNKLKGMPCKIPTLTETKKQPRILSKREFMRVRDACKHGGARLALILAYQAGLRHDEIVHLRVRDFRPCPQAEGIYTIDVTAHDGWTPKAHAERSVDLPESTIHEIASYVFTEHPFYDDPDSPLICWGVTKPRRYRDLYVPVREAFQAAGLHRKEDKSGLHMLRRSFASHLLSGGMDLKTVMAMGGWSTIEAVERYLATTDVLRRRAARILELD